MAKKYFSPDTTIYIYKLIDPRNDAIRYIGWCRIIQRRYNEHLSEAKRGFTGHKNNWIRQLQKENLKPIMKIIEISTFGLFEVKEKMWIKHYGRENLTNDTDGGEGTLGYVPTPENIEIAASSRRGKSSWCKGIPMRQETKDKLSKAKKGKPGTWKGRKHTEESKKKISQKAIGRPSKLKGIPMTEENKRKLSKSKKEKMTDEIRKRMSDSKKGKVAKNKGIKLNVASSSKYIGVYWHNQSEGWRARIVDLDGKRIHIGLFPSEILAAIAYNEFASDLYGYKAQLNIISEEKLNSIWND